MAVSGSLGDDRTLDDAIDTNEDDLRDTQPGELQLDGPSAAAHMKDPVADPRFQTLDQERGEVVVPPFLTHVLQGRGGQRIECARLRGHRRHGRLIYHTEFG